MPGVARKGDRDNAGGMVQGDVDDTVLINGKPAAMLNSLETPHRTHNGNYTRPPHDNARIAKVAPSVVGAGGKGLAYVGSELSCGHQIIEGSGDVIIGLGNMASGEVPRSAVTLLPESNPAPLTAKERAAVAVSKQQAANGIIKNGEAPPRESVGEAKENVDADKIWETLQANLEVCLAEASGGAWKETGKNPNILACSAAIGVPAGNDDVAWCAAFAGAMLKKCGAGGLKTLSSRQYASYGEAIPVSDPSKWRMNDIVVFSRAGGGHVGFVKSVSPSQGLIKVVGGNQSNNLTLQSFQINSSSLTLTDVRRKWKLPAAADVSIVTSNIAAAPPNIKVT